MWLRPRFQRWRRVTVGMSPVNCLIAGDASGTQVGGKLLIPYSEQDAETGQMREDPRVAPFSAPLPVTFNRVKVRNGHSTTTELYGALFLIMTVVLILNIKDAHIKYLGDSTVCKAYISRLGGRKRHLCRILEPYLPMLRRRRLCRLLLRR